MRRRWKVAALVVAVVLVAGGALLALTLRGGLSALDEPSPLEAMLAARMRRWATPAELRDARNPLAATPAVLEEARAHWADHCASCHGNDGKGQTPIGSHLYPRAPDMTLPRTQELSDGELFAVIENGIRLTGMPGWGDGTAASAYDSWALVHLTRRLPQITPEELAAMEALNPRTPEEWEELREEEAFLEGEDAGDAAPSPAGATDHHH